MAILTMTMVTVGTAPTANCFELAHVDLANSDPEMTVSVWWNAWKKDKTAKTLVANLGPHVIKNGDTDFVAAHPGISAARLDAVSADAFTRAKAYETKGVPTAGAYQNGYRDALYAELQLAGKVPVA